MCTNHLRAAGDFIPAARFIFSGAASQDRTGDLCVTNAMLYQLS